MRSYVISSLTPEDIEKVTKFFTEQGLAGSIEGLYWLPLPEELLTALQKEHNTCGPHVLSIEIGVDSVSMELLVRARNQLRCDCISYMDMPTAEAMIERLHSLLKKCGVDC